MKKTNILKMLSFALCIVLIAAIALMTSGCNDNATLSGETSTVVENLVKDDTTQETGAKKLGEGKTTFNFTVVDLEGKETAFEISTDKTTVGAALLDVELIAGEDSAYGLYVKTVNGLTLDYDTDGKYWAFYVNGQYAMSGIDTTDIVAGNVYSFKAE